MLKIHSEYKTYGVDNFYKNFSKIYKNPHEEKIDNIYKKYIKEEIKKNDKILDIACGDGLISRLILNYNENNNVDGLDPYFSNQYVKYNMDFKDIVSGKLLKEKLFYDVCICSYAFHLIPNEMVYDFLTQLSFISSKLIIISPSKKLTIYNELWFPIKLLREDKITLIILEKK